MNYAFYFRSARGVLMLLTLSIAIVLVVAPCAMAQQADPDHRAHQTSLARQLKELQAKVAQLEATLEQNGKAAARGPAQQGGAGGQGMGMMDDDMDEMGPMQPSQGTPAGGMGMMDDAMGKMKPMQPGQAAPAAGGMGAMGDGASPPGIDAGMMERLDKMIGMMDMMVRMMDKTVGMMDRMTGGKGGSSMPPAQVAPAAAGMGMMDDDQMEMSGMGGGSMQPGQAAPPMGDMK